MVDDWLAHVPLEVLAQNLGLNASVLANIPAKGASLAHLLS